MHAEAGSRTQGLVALPAAEKAWDKLPDAACHVSRAEQRLLWRRLGQAVSGPAMPAGGSAEVEAAKVSEAQETPRQIVPRPKQLCLGFHAFPEHVATNQMRQISAKLAFWVRTGGPRVSDEAGVVGRNVTAAIGEHFQLRLRAVGEIATAWALSVMLRRALFGSSGNEWGTD
jgi:hypothetical protein